MTHVVASTMPPSLTGQKDVWTLFFLALSESEVEYNLCSYIFHGSFVHEHYREFWIWIMQTPHQTEALNRRAEGPVLL